MREGWEYKKLGDLYTITSSKRVFQSEWKSEGVPFYRAREIVKLAQFGEVDNELFISEQLYKDYTSKYGKPVQGDLMVTGVGTLGICYQVKDGDEFYFKDGNIIWLKDKVDYISSDYIEYAFKSDSVKEFIASGNGATVATYTIDRAKQTSIPVPPLSVQQTIVSELDTLSVIIAKYKEQLADYDKLEQSIFYDMFGDPVKNEKGFPCFTMNDIVEFQGGSQPDKQYFEYEPTEDNIRLIQIRDYKTDRYITYIPKSLARKVCDENEIMIGRYGPPIFQILKGISGAYNVALMKAVPKKGNREFIRAFLKQKCLLQYLENFSRRVAGQDGIQMDKLKMYPFPYPPMELQNLFEKKQKAIDVLREKTKMALQEAELLFNARMDSWFNIA